LYKIDFIFIDETKESFMNGDGYASDTDNKRSQSVGEYASDLLDDLKETSSELGALARIFPMYGSILRKMAKEEVRTVCMAVEPAVLPAVKKAADDVLDDFDRNMSKHRSVLRL
jgi:hypothetical protein